MTLSECFAVGGLFRGEGSDCATDPCGAGACCFGGGGGCVPVAAFDCTVAGQVFYGSGTLCDQFPDCPGLESGACCFADGTCSQPLQQSQCWSLGGQFHAGTSCSDGGLSICPLRGYLLDSSSYNW